MVIFTFLNEDRQIRVGVLPKFEFPYRHDGYDITPWYPTVEYLISSGRSGLERVCDVMTGKAKPVEMSQCVLLAPIPEPRRNVFCVGWNYLKHFEEGVVLRDPEASLPDYPNFFTKSTLSVVGPGTPVPFDKTVTQMLDYEAEIAVIIGAQGKNIPLNRAMDYVWGYTLANDVSARDVQRRHGGQWFKGKSLDASCPLGPGIVTADEITDPRELDIRCFVNGEKRQEASLRQLIFPIDRLIHELSQGMTLLPGDILLTGTPDGIGAALNPPRFLKCGDVMRVESSQLGQLINLVE